MVSPTEIQKWRMTDDVKFDDVSNAYFLFLVQPSDAVKADVGERRKPKGRYQPYSIPSYNVPVG